MNTIADTGLTDKEVHREEKIREEAFYSSQ